MKIDKKQIAKLFTFAMFVGGATAIYLYVNKNKKEKPPLPPSPPSNEVYVNGVVRTNTSDLNVREEPSTTSKIISKLKKGTKILVGDDINGWRKVVDESKNTIGFVSSQYVALA